MRQNRQTFPAISRPTSWCRLRQGRAVLIAVLILGALVLSACLSLLSPTTPIRTPVVLPAPGGNQPQIAISPPSGYAGVYVQVVGNGWPVNDLVLVALSDESGRSGILAASAANSSGQVTTGFLYPISPRWLTPGNHTIVAYTADGNLQATAEFLVTPGDGVTPVATGQTATPATPTVTAPAVQTPTTTATSSAPATATPSATATRPPAPTPIVISDWRGDYWANSTLSGEAPLVRNDTAVFFDWGDGSPAPNLPADQFSARWTRQLSFDAGLYHFFLEVDDGARLYIDDQLVLDEWRAGSQRVVSVSLPLAAGRHTLRVEYFERTGLALARFWWERQLAFTGWEGRYFTNPNLQGDPTIVRDDATINFDWGSGSPAPAIGGDNFSVRWKRTVAFAPGRYRFYARMDDGLRVRIDGQLLLEEWRDGSDRTVAVEVELPGGNYQIEVDYYEKTGGALASFWWEVAPAPTPTHTPSWTPVATATDIPSPTPTATDAPTPTSSPSPEPTATPTETATVAAIETATETATATPVVTETATVVASGGTATPIADIPEIGQPVAFVRLTLPLLLPPKRSIFQAVTSDDEWSALLESLRPPKNARPALRPTQAGRGPTATPTPSQTPTLTPTATVTGSEGGVGKLPGAPPLSPGQLTEPINPDFSSQIALVAILGVDRLGESVEIVDVRQEANELYVKVRFHKSLSRALPIETATAGVIIRQDGLPPLELLEVHFVDEFYQAIEAMDSAR